MASATQTLKTATREAHERIEERLAPYFREDSAVLYRALLARWYGFLKPWEALVMEKLPADLRLFFAPRSKLPLLIADLQALELSGPALEDLPLSTQMPAINSLAAAFGSQYVVEGSTLGGKFLAKRLRQSAVIPGSALNYYLCYGDAVGERWREFQSLLTDRVSPEAETELVSAAVETFALLESWLAPIEG